jgi:hypothetical protein
MKTQKGSVSMNKQIIRIISLGSLLVAGCTSHNPNMAGKELRELTHRNATSHVARIGVYDSRAVALTFIKSDRYAQVVADLERRECEAELAELKYQFHAQVLSMASVDNILDYIKDQLPDVAERARIDLILSKWDSESLAAYPSAEQVDITMQLVDVFNPGEEQVKDALATLELDPISLEQAERMRHL